MSIERVRHFQEELEQLKTRLLEMGGLAEEQVRLAVLGLVQRDRALVARVLTSDEPINALHIEIDSRCFTLIALHQPMAVDLRAIVSAVKINTDLERVGDLAINIAEAVRATKELDSWPLIFKPADSRGGGSRGITRVNAPSEIEAALDRRRPVRPTSVQRIEQRRSSRR